MRSTSTSRRRRTTAPPSTSSTSGTCRSMVSGRSASTTPQGYYEKNPYNAYSLNNLTAKKERRRVDRHPVRRLRRQSPELPADREGLELHRAALSAARRNPERQVEIPGAAASQLRGRHVRSRYLRLDRPHHSSRERDRGVLYRRLATRAHCENARSPVGASRDGGRLGHADLRLRALAGRADLGLCRCARTA